MTNTPKPKQLHLNFSAPRIEPRVAAVDAMNSLPEKLVNIKIASDQTGIPYWKLQRAAKRGLFQTYRLLNSRALVRVSEIIKAMERSRHG
jgi:hypothetical protein